MKKRILSFLLAAVLAVSLVPGTAFAATIVDSGFCGQDGNEKSVTWTLDSEGTLTISGSGEMSYDPSYTHGYGDSIKRIEIKEGVTVLNWSTFAYCTNLISVSLSSTVTGVWGYYFDNCSGLTDITVDEDNDEYFSVDGVLFNYYGGKQPQLLRYPAGRTGAYTIPDGIVRIWYEAFVGCRGLTSVTIPNSITKYDVMGDNSSPFAGCNSLTSIQVEAGNENYSSLDGVLFNKDQSELVRFPAGKKQAYYAVPDGVTEIERNSFMDCISLTALTIPSSVISIGDYGTPFKGCSGLTNITVDANNEMFSSLDGVLFNKDQSELILYPSGRTGAYSIPNGVTKIGNAITDCRGLTSVIIPGSVTSIGIDTPFRGCCNLTSITVDANSENYSSLDGVLFNRDQTRMICCPPGKAGDYTIPDGVTDIGQYGMWSNYQPFEDCAKLTSVTIPSSVTNISRGVSGVPFDGCTNLTSFHVDADNNAFSSLDGVLFDKEQSTLIQFPAGKEGAYTIPGGTETIGFAAFSGCKKVTSIAIPISVTEIEFRAFEVGRNLTDIYYEGTKSQWDTITSGYFEKDQTIDAEVHFEWVPETPSESELTGLIVGFDTDEVTVYMENIPAKGAALPLAVYDSDGQMISVVIRQVAAGETELTIPVNLDGAYSVKAFLLDAAGKPLADAMDADLSRTA